MRTIAVLAVLLLAACGGSEDTSPTTVAGQADACAAVRSTLDVAAQAYEAVEGEPPADLAVMVGDYVETDTPTDWFTVADGEVEPVDGGPCG